MKRQCPISAEEAIDTIESIGHTQNNLRRAHANGLAFDALFEPSGAAMPWTTAAHLQKQAVPAVVRFSYSSPQEDPRKQLIPVKGMAVRFELPDGTHTNLTMANIPIFISKTPEAFMRLLQAFANEDSWNDRWKTLLHDTEYKAYLPILKNLRPMQHFETLHYYAIHAYYLVNSAQERQAVRFAWEPFPQNSNSTLDGSLENSLIKKVKQEQIRFRLLIQLAEKGDPTDDPTEQWPDDRRKIEAGVLTLKSLRPDSAEQIVFDPTDTVAGIECSDDPVLRFRSAAYAESARRRSTAIKPTGM